MVAAFWATSWCACGRAYDCGSLSVWLGMLFVAVCDFNQLPREIFHGVVATLQDSSHRISWRRNRMFPAAWSPAVNIAWRHTAANVSGRLCLPRPAYLVAATHAATGILLHCRRRTALMPQDAAEQSTLVCLAFLDVVRVGVALLCCFHLHIMSIFAPSLLCSYVSAPIAVSYSRHLSGLLIRRFTWK